jgi:hypothetical protein
LRKISLLLKILPADDGLFCLTTARYNYLTNCYQLASYLGGDFSFLNLQAKLHKYELSVHQAAALPFLSNVP